MAADGERARLLEAAVLQYLAGRGLHAACEELERAAGLPAGAAGGVEAALGSPAALEAAMDLWAERRAAAAAAAEGGAAEAAEEERALREPRGDAAGDAPPRFERGAAADAAVNVLAARLDRDDGEGLRFAAGLADRTVRVYGGGGEELWRGEGPAPALSVDLQPGSGGTRAAAGFMNGAVALLRQGAARPAALLKDHAKYVTCVRFAPGEGLLATSSHDGTVRVYACGGDGDALEFRHEFVLPGPVEAIEWLGRGGAAAPVLAATARDNNYLHVLDAAAGTVAARWNMNALGDDHVSFTGMSLSSSADGRFVAVATDRSRTIVFGARSGRQVRNLYGATNDSYSHARSVFGASGSHVYGSSQDGHALLAWDLGSERVVAREPRAHRGVVRDLDAHPARPCLVTASFDKTAQLWNGCP